MTEKVLGTGEKPACILHQMLLPVLRRSLRRLNKESGRTECAGKNFVERSWLWSQKPLKLTLLYNTSENHQKIGLL